MTSERYTRPDRGALCHVDRREHGGRWELLSVRIPVFLAMELSLAAFLLAILPAQIRRSRELRLLRGRELAYMSLQAFFGIALFRALTLYGLRRSAIRNSASKGRQDVAHREFLKLRHLLLLGVRGRRAAGVDEVVVAGVASVCPLRPAPKRQATTRNRHKF